MCIRDSSNGGVVLYHDNAQKLETTSTGVDVTGTATMDGLTVNSSEVLFDNTGGDFTLKLHTNAVSDKNEIIMGDSGTPLAKFGVGGTANDIITGSDGQDFNIGTAGGGRAINFSTDNFASVEMKLDNGNLGIGRTPISYANSQNTLVIEDSHSPAIAWSDTGQARDWFAVAQGSGLHFVYADDGGTGGAANVTTSLVLDNSGNCGIGIDSPAGSGLHIKKDTSSTTNELLRLSNSAGSTTDGVKIVMEVANTSGND